MKRPEHFPAEAGKGRSMTLAALNPLANQRADEASARTVAGNPVQRLDLVRLQPDLDCDPAFLAGLFGCDLRFTTFSHGNSQNRTAPEGAAGSGDKCPLVASLGPPAGSLLSILGVCGEGIEVTPDRLAHQKGNFQTRGLPACLGALDQGHRVGMCISHVDLQFLSIPSIWGPHMDVNGVPITFARAA